MSCITKYPDLGVKTPQLQMHVPTFVKKPMLLHSTELRADLNLEYFATHFYTRLHTFFLPHTADCGPPPSGMDVSFTVSPENSVTNSDGILVTNNGATATYTCDDPAATLVGSATLVCDGGLEEWNGMAPECESPVGKYCRFETEYFKSRFQLIFSCKISSNLPIYHID